MKRSRKSSVFSAAATTTTTVTYAFENDRTAPPSHSNSTQIPIHSSPEPPTPVTVHLPQKLQSAAAAKIQASYRAHMIRTLFKKISSVNSEAGEFQRLIQRQETVDAVRSNDREKIRLNEWLMSLLLRLDSVPGVDQTVREARRKVSRRIVGLQEILDSVAEAKVDYYEGEWDPHGYVRNWDDVVGGMEEEMCRERGGEEMERFCVDNLGFRCLQRFLREP